MLFSERFKRYNITYSLCFRCILRNKKYTDISFLWSLLAKQSFAFGTVNFSFVRLYKMRCNEDMVGDACTRVVNKINANLMLV